MMRTGAIRAIKRIEFIRTLLSLIYYDYYYAQPSATRNSCYWV